MDIRALSRGTGAFCLLVGSIAFAIPVTVTEKDLDGAGQLRSAASHLGVTHLGNTLLLGQLLLIPAMIYAARLARHRSPKLAFFGGGIAALAWLCGLVAFGGLQVITYWGAQMPDNSAVATVLDKAGDDPVLGVLTLLFVFGHIVGIVLLGAALWKSHAVPVWAAIAMILYPLLHFGAHVGGSVAVDDVSGILLFVACAVCAVRILRTPNATWDLPTGASVTDRAPVAEPVPAV
jgi:hypothetical protein